MAINPYVKPQKKSENWLAPVMSAVGTIGGSLVGGPAGPAVGSALGGLAGGMLQKDNSKPAEASPTIGGGGDDGAMGRRLASLQGDPYAQVRDASFALANLPADQRGAAAEPILKALQAGARNKPMVG